jgi:hypothetical protein
MRGVMLDPTERKKRERHSGPPCRHYPHKFKTEAAHMAKLAARKRSHVRSMKTSLDYRLRAVLRTIVQRCEDPRHVGYRWYGGKGIKNFLNFDMLKFMWIRDGADQMKKPSIDRRNSDLHYTFGNCRFIELRTNQERSWKNKQARTQAIRKGMEAHSHPPLKTPASVVQDRPRVLAGGFSGEGAEQFRLTDLRPHEQKVPSEN